MQRNFSTSVIGWLFCLAGLMLWLGWMILPVHLGAYFEPGNFAAIHEQFHLWIWMFRIHLFGFVIAAMAFVSTAGATSEPDVRVLIWPGAAVSMAGLIVSALGAAFYYHHGAWGALELSRQSFQDVPEHIAALRVDTEYVTCLVRFGRVFFGLGQLVFVAGLLRWDVLPQPIAWAGGLLGVAAMALTMAFPDQLEFYAPVFHLNSLWLVAAGLTLCRSVPSTISAE
jgi:hypothetical protein